MIPVKYWGELIKMMELARNPGFDFKKFKKAARIMIHKLNRKGEKKQK